MQFPKHIHFLMASLLSAVLLTLSWQPFGLVFPVFVGFVPLLWLEQKLREQHKGSPWLLFYAFIACISWNIGTTYWLWNASPEGAIMAFLINATCMCLPIMIYRWMQFRMTEKDANRVFIFLWVAFEYAHHNWEAAWPWLSLGNVFSPMPWMVQWYEYTGIFGGSLWVLYVNVKLFQYVMNWKDRSVMMRYSKALNLIFFTVFAPVFLSLYLGNDVKVNGKNLNVVVVQPNIDPYNDKFGGMTPVEQTRKMLMLAEQQVDSTTQLVCFPETALQGSINEENFKNNTSILLLQQFLLAHPQLVVLSGADTYKFYPDKQHASKTARQYEGDQFYDAYNTALLLDQSDSLQVYHKSKLVPGVESLPYVNTFGFIKKLTIDLGGTSGSLGSDPSSKAFFINQHNINTALVAPVICYESVFGEYVTSYVKKGADLICILTNDGWWGNTPGYKQHFDYARLRAIETRKYVARSANTGLSGFIDPKGNIISKSEWWKPEALKATVILNTGETFYVKFGDYLGKMAVMLSGLYLILKRRRIE